MSGCRGVRSYSDWVRASKKHGVRVAYDSQVLLFLRIVYWRPVETMAFNH